VLLASGCVIISPCRKSFTVDRLTFIYLPYEPSLGQASAHCPRFLTAAPRRSSALFSVPTWLSVLPNQLRIIGLVSFYLTNYLNLQQPIQKRSIFFAVTAIYPVFYPGLLGKFYRITHSFATLFRAFNSHVLSTIPAFILGQDHTQ
jgi:hypothetical protein